MVRDTHPTGWTSLFALMLWGLEELKARRRNLTGGVKSGKIISGGCGLWTASGAGGAQTRQDAFGVHSRPVVTSALDPSWGMICANERRAETHGRHEKRRNVFVTRRLPLLAIAALMFWSDGITWGQAESAVVINELHTNPDVKTELVEFIELYNAGTTEVDLSGWQFTEGVLYTFPAGAKLSAGEYIIVAQSPDGIGAKWNVGRAGLSDGVIFGPYAGGLENDGERVVLRDAAGAVADEVEYQLGFPWPTVGDPASEAQPGTGRSMQLVNPAFDNDLGGSWRSALPTPAAANKSVLAANIPPHIRQVKHSPKQPRSAEAVTITAKVTDPDGVVSVSLAVPGRESRFLHRTL